MAWRILFHLIFPATIWHKFCKKNLCSNSYHYFVPKNLHMPYGISLYLLQCCHFPALLEISVKPHLFFFITTWQNNKVAYSGLVHVLFVVVVLYIRTPRSLHVTQVCNVWKSGLCWKDIGRLGTFIQWIFIPQNVKRCTLREKSAVKEASHCKSQNKVRLYSKKGLMQEKLENGKLVFEYFS